MSASGQKTGGLILAAGLSSRMGDFKPLLAYGERTVLETVILQMKRAGLDTVVVVTGHRAEELSGLLSACGAHEVRNPDYRGEMFLSIRHGLRALLTDGPLQGVFLTPVDCPAVTAEDYRLVMNRAGGKAACAGFLGRKGHPLYLPGELLAGIVQYRGDGGMKGAMAGVPIQVIDSENEGVLLDMDTPEGYEKLLQYRSLGCRFPSAAEAMAGRRLLFIRHGQIRQHAEPVFLGQYDPPLSELGLAQAGRAAKAIHAYAPHPDAVFVSPLRRAVQTGQLIADALCVPLKTDSGLMELSLGRWDGRPIGEIRQCQPEAFEARGRDLLHFIPPGGESMIHLRIRVLEALRRIARETDVEDVVIVTHAGVINTALSLLEDRPDDVCRMSKPPLGGITVWTATRKTEDKL